MFLTPFTGSGGSCDCNNSICEPLKCPFLSSLMLKNDPSVMGPGIGNSMFGMGMGIGMGMMKPFSPILCADLVESPNDFHVYFDLPGVELSDLDCEIINGKLVIKAERKEAYGNDVDVHRTERNFGKLKRVFTIPENADVDRVSTTMLDGVLKVSFPKKIMTGGVRKLAISNIAHPKALAHTSNELSLLKQNHFLLTQLKKENSTFSGDHSEEVGLIRENHHLLTILTEQNNFTRGQHNKQLALLRENFHLLQLLREETKEMCQKSPTTTSVPKESSLTSK